jgi:sugar phosphate isomerase/epimerase
MNLALQLYSVRDDMEKDFLGTLKKVKELGYDGGELAGLYGYSGEEVRDMFKEIGLTPISAHVTYNDIIADIECTVKTYKTIGCKYMAIPYLPEDMRYGTDVYDEITENFKKIAKCCNENGITLLYHNHDFEFLKTKEGKYVLDDLYERLDKTLLQTEIDTCWVNVGGENPSEYVLKYTGRAPIVHLKDFDGEKDENMYELIGIEGEKKAVKKTFEFRPLGYGKQDFVSILKAAEKAGAEWVVAEQDNPSLNKTPLECAEMSINYIKPIL